MKFQKIKFNPQSVMRHKSNVRCFSRWLSSVRCQLLSSVSRFSRHRSNVKCFFRVRCQKGFTLLEVLIVIGILAVLTSVSAPIYRSFVKTSELGVTAKTMMSLLKEARSKSMTGNLNLRWGVHFVNGGADYYESFSTPTDYSDSSKSVVATTSLPLGVNFTEPVTTSDIIFGKIIGTTTATTTVTFTSADNESKTVTVTPIGNIY